MVRVGEVSAIDPISGALPASFTLSAVSNEPDSGLGPDDLPNDIQISGSVLQLRAERSDTGTGRVYTINITATDRAGNVGTCEVICRVPLR